MKILLIHNFYQSWGGEDTYVTSLKKLLETYHHQVYLYFKDSKTIKRVWDKMRAGISLFYNPWVKKELSKIIKEFKPDIAHFHNVYPLIGATAYRVCKKYNIPIIQHIHNYRFMCPKGILFRNGKICELCVRKNWPFYSIIFGCYHGSRMASLFLSFAFFFHKIIRTFDFIDKFIFPSEFIRDYYLKHLKIYKEKTDLLAFFIDIKPIKRKVKKGDHFLFVGRLSEEKGIVQLLEVFKTLPEQKLLVIGDGPLKKEVGKYEKYKNITLIGFLPRDIIAGYIKKAKAIIISSLCYEVMPLVSLEALNQNIPVFIPDSDCFRLMFKSIKKSSPLPLYYFRDFEDLKNKIVNISKLKLSKKTLSLREYKLRYSSQAHFKLLFNIYKALLFKSS